MKVLFAVNNESISESIIKKYQQEYKEIISGKNVYYFNAIAKELQRDKSYDRIIISEDLEPFSNNNYEVIDRFIFERLDSISDEATSINGQDIPIILICADRRTKSDSLLVKIFGIGIYSALLGQDRSITKVCELINKPRSKKDAKVYYRIESNDVDYKTESESDVSEIEIQNILNHYKRLGRNEEQYVISFDNIASQYTDGQLRVICKFLPLNVRAVLESNSPKYQELITFGAASSKQGKYVPNQEYQKNAKQSKYKNNIEIIEKNIGKSNLTKPVIIPSSRKISDVKKVIQQTTEDESEIKKPQEKVVKEELPIDDNTIEDILPGIEEENQGVVNSSAQEVLTESPKKKRGRPRKIQTQENMDSTLEQAPKKKRGRPRKIQPEEISILPGFDEDESENIKQNYESDNIDDIFNDFETNKESEVNLFDLGEQEENEEQAVGIVLPGFDDDVEEVINQEEDTLNYTQATNDENIQLPYTVEDNITREIQNKNQFLDINLDSLLTRDKKVVAFVGTSKNGTSFLVNNIAELVSQKGINTAILDLTKNKNSYYIYTQNEEELRKKAFSCIQNLKNGIPDGIQINKNLTVYTMLPDENEEINDYENILKTLAQNYSLVLMDCDFDTNYGYFKNAQEIYLVQSFDILTIQPLTAFLRELKSKNILEPEKLRVVLNKTLRVKSVTERTIIGGMSFYNDPAMSFMTELFNKDTIKYCAIPFEEQTYSKYLEGLVNCEITTRGYSKNFLMNLEKLSNMVYPLLSSDKNTKNYNSYQTNNFSSGMNETLNKMKRNY